MGETSSGPVDSIHAPRTGKGRRAPSGSRLARTEDRNGRDSSKRPSINSGEDHERTIRVLQVTIGCLMLVILAIVYQQYRLDGRSWPSAMAEDFVGVAITGVVLYVANMLALAKVLALRANKAEEIAAHVAALDIFDQLANTLEQVELDLQLIKRHLTIAEAQAVPNPSSSLRPSTSKMNANLDETTTPAGDPAVNASLSEAKVIEAFSGSTAQQADRFLTSNTDTRLRTLATSRLVAIVKNAFGYRWVSAENLATLFTRHHTTTGTRDQASAREILIDMANLGLLEIQDPADEHSGGRTDYYRLTAARPLPSRLSESMGAENE